VYGRISLALIGSAGQAGVMAVEIMRVDVDNDADVEVLFGIEEAARAVDVPDFPARTLREEQLALRHPSPGGAPRHFVARVDGEPVGHLGLDLPQLDNTHLLEVDLTVHPDRRREGIGRALYEFAVDYARAHDRNVLIGQYVTSREGDPEHSQGHGAFAAAVGATTALPEVRRRLDLTTVDAASWADQLAAARTHADGYTAITWVGDAPDDVVAEVARLEGRMVIDAPMGDLILEQEKYDADRIRGIEKSLRLRGRRHYHAAVRHDATGTLAAWTMIAFDAETANHAWQQTTIVDPDHRGHRLGTIVKIENLYLTRRHEPAVRYIHTWNAASNRHMIAINEALGFRVMDNWATWQHEV
jgi:GNAT superfamily N-acetyltransferase